MEEIHRVEGQLLLSVQTATKRGWKLVHNQWGFDTDETGVIAPWGPKQCCLIGAVLLHKYGGERTEVPARANVQVRREWHARLAAQALGITEEEVVLLRKGFDHLQGEGEEQSPWWRLGAELRCLT